MRYLSSLIIFILLFSACSSKNTQDRITTTKKSFEIEDEDDFSDEFEDEETDNDPFESYNRFMTSFNDTTFVYVLNPISKVYTYVMPEPARVSVSNFFENIFFPVRFVNNILQAKFKNSLDEFNRFVINSTIGIFGLFDPATSWFDIKAHKEDFGQTLGFWGVGAGPHIVIPFIGPSNLRDALSLSTDYYLDPKSTFGDLKYKLPRNEKEAYALSLFYGINKNSLNLGLYENFKKDALDLYPFLKDVYEQKRAQEIRE